MSGNPEIFMPHAGKIHVVVNQEQVSTSSCTFLDNTISKHFQFVTETGKNKNTMSKAFRNDQPVTGYRVHTVELCRNLPLVHVGNAFSV